MITIGGLLSVTTTYYFIVVESNRGNQNKTGTRELASFTDDTSGREKRGETSDTKGAWCTMQAFCAQSIVGGAIRVRAREEQTPRPSDV